MDKRSGTKRIAFAGIAAAGATVLLLLSRVLPTGQLGIVAAASLFVCAAYIEYGAGCALGAYVVAATLGFLVAPGVPAWLFALFFGYYPIIRLLTENRINRIIALVIKLAVFYGALFVLMHFGLLPDIELPLPDEFLPVILGFAFLIYDFGYGGLIEYYRRRVSRRSGR